MMTKDGRAFDPTTQHISMEPADRKQLEWKQAAVSLLFAVLTVALLAACGRQPSLRPAEGQLTLTRSTSAFVFDDLGPLEREYRLFGVNPDPLGANNRDDYVANFGVVLLATHLLIADHRSKASAEFTRAHCEQESAEEGLRITVIAESPAARGVLNEIDQQSRRERVCARLIGRDLRFREWRIDGVPRDQAMVDRMTRKSGGFDFSAPFLVQSVQVVPCD
jgi:hypothetical protein